MKAAPCTVFRPDSTGQLVAVGLARPTPRSVNIRSGPFVVWDDQCQATSAGDTLSACAEYVCAGDFDESREEIVRLGTSGVQPLNTAERAELRRLIQEGSK